MNTLITLNFPVTSSLFSTQDLHGKIQREIHLLLHVQDEYEEEEEDRNDDEDEEYMDPYGEDEGLC